MLTFCNTLKNIKLNNIKLIIAPSNPYFLLFKEENINLCAQDISLYDAKMLTGDLTLKTLKSLNVKYTLIGHSERIEYYNENSDTILTKIKNALKNNLKVIYLIGETKEELDNNTKYYILEKKITYILNDIPKSEFKNIIIAYEPFYLINGGPLNIKTITETINFIKNIIGIKFYPISFCIRYIVLIFPLSHCIFWHIKSSPFYSHSIVAGGLEVIS